MEPQNFLGTYQGESRRETQLQCGLWLGMAVRGVGESGAGIPPVSSTRDWRTYSDHAYYRCAHIDARRRPRVCSSLEARGRG